ncbi:hypothetical protein HWQ46_24305 [Shewanella sp. D64]|uniref:hypothetical protein n=1 Tax=unclassified Shewanella TaxID=196818 RepID=UPI0022BA1E3D|nr:MULTISPECIES: hypothetical protein [unclassified Shewanella]MEC4728649.1 hypothetical protein [Shewanella sp. D64]MEC4740588.1 hypothetical protein [Shewanella sp. E94]WBJ95104.1 hypothetical protein HWQ47_25385 [Shewanella sp. MTB7]
MNVELNQQLDDIAHSYVRLVLAVGLHDPSYVDAYYGPESWQVECQKEPLESLLRHVRTLLDRISVLRLEGVIVKLKDRQAFLIKQLNSVEYYIKHLQGSKGSFELESISLYDTQADNYSPESFEPALDDIAKLLPGEGSLSQRFEVYRAQFIVPHSRIPQVFASAVEKARELTSAYLELPENESFSIEFVNDKVWSAYNWYQGSYQSLIQLNQDQPLYLERCMELASHEGYPGHHVFNLLQERELVRKEQWLEYAVYPLYSPISFLSEGSANYGLSLIMSAKELIEFERDQLMPLAGIKGDIEHYHRVLTSYKKLAHLDNSVCRQLTDGNISQSEAESLLIRYGLYSQSRAKQRVRFYWANRAYVINYNHGEDSVAQWVERGGVDKSERWKRFEALLKRPLMASQFVCK